MSPLTTNQYVPLGRMGGRIATVLEITRWHKEMQGQDMDSSEVQISALPPLMGLQEEQYIPSHRSRSLGWAAFYTGIANGMRVYVWSYYKTGERDGLGACVMVSDLVFDPGYGAGVAEIQHMFVTQHINNKNAGMSRTHRFKPADPFLLQVFLYEVTRGGNENMELLR